MSTTAEALAPQNDAPVSPDAAQPDGAAPQTGHEADPSPAAKTDAGDSPKRDSFQDRINELTRLRRDEERQRQQTERDRDHWRELAMRNQAPKPEPEAPAKPKTLADFNFDDGEYQRHLALEAGDAAAKRVRAELKAEQEAAAKQRRVASYVQAAKEFAKDKPDFHDVASSSPISDEMAETIIDLKAPELADYLGRNHEVAVQLSNLPNRVAAYELGMLAARLKYEREAVAKAKAVVSGAPPPPPSIGASGEGSAKVSTTSPDSDRMSDDEWIKAENARLKRKAQRQA